MNVEEVMLKISKDKAMWVRVQGELAKAKDRHARFIELAREVGMPVDASELQQASQNFGRELSEIELNAVSGGVQLTAVPAKHPARYLGLIDMLLPQKTTSGGF
jgi:hypothetical protein